jgi:hypothetical protein
LDSNGETGYVLVGDELQRFIVSTGEITSSLQVAPNSLNLNIDLHNSLLGAASENGVQLIRLEQ